MQDVLRRIKNAEAQAEQMIQVATAEVAQRVAAAQAQCLSLVHEAEHEADRQSALIMGTGNQSAESKVRMLQQQAVDDCEKTRLDAQKRLHEAVKLVRERVIRRDGRS